MDENASLSSSSYSSSSSNDDKLYSDGVLIFGVVAYFGALLLLLHSLISLLKQYKYDLSYPRIWVFISFSLSCLCMLLALLINVIHSFNIVVSILYAAGNNLTLNGTLFVGALWIKLVNVVLYKGFKPHLANTYTKGEFIILFIAQPLMLIRFITTLVLEMLTGNYLIYPVAFIISVAILSIGATCFGIIILVKLSKEQGLSSKRPALVKMTKMVLFTICLIIIYIVYTAIFASETNDLSHTINLAYLLVLYMVVVFGFGTGFLNQSYTRWMKRLSSKFASSSFLNLPEQLRKMDLNSSTGGENKDSKESQSKESKETTDGKESKESKESSCSSSVIVVADSSSPSSSSPPSPSPSLHSSSVSPPSSPTPLSPSSPSSEPKRELGSTVLLMTAV